MSEQLCTACGRNQLYHRLRGRVDHEFTVREVTWMPVWRRYQQQFGKPKEVAR